MIDKKPCPWCGSTNTASPPGMAVIVCGDCEATGPFGTAHPTSDSLTELAARKKWNDRPWETDSEQLEIRVECQKRLIEVQAEAIEVLADCSASLDELLGPNLFEKLSVRTREAEATRKRDVT